jgi:regulatory protein
MRTEAELRRLLERRAEPGQRGRSVIDAVVFDLKQRRYLDDRAFAETYARLRLENEKFGPRRVRQRLRQKGISSALTQTTVEAAYAATSEEDLARRHLERKGIGKPSNDKQAAALTRRLLAAGFSAGVISRILSQWNVACPSLESLDDLSEDDGQE